MSRVGVPAELADQRHAALFLRTSAVGFVALVFAGTGEAIGLLAGRRAAWSRRLLPAVGAAVAIAPARRLRPAPGAAAEPSGEGRIRTGLWRAAALRPRRRADDRRASSATATAC